MSCAPQDQTTVALPTESTTLLLTCPSNTDHEDPTSHTLITGPEYRHVAPASVLTPAKFHEVTDLLLAQPNLNSSHLFRADILWDSEGLLRTKEELEADDGLVGKEMAREEGEGDGVNSGWNRQWYDERPVLSGVPPHRTVIRRLIPRNQNLDRPLEQTCCLYKLDDGKEAVVYLPHVRAAAEMPWYHPTLRVLVYVYEPTMTNGDGEVAISVCYLPFEKNESANAQSQRLHRTLLGLGKTFLRLARFQASTKQPPIPTNDAPTKHVELIGTASNRSDGPADRGDIDLRPAHLKTTLLPQHLTQDTYSVLKTRYAPYLIASWVEATPPEKHVFEDLSIAAFLLELWKKMYRSPGSFPGFVDLACGNGLLVWVLNKEGWYGKGVDARRRKTWASLRLEEEGKVEEAVIIPKPFEESLKGEGIGHILGHSGTSDDATGLSTLSVKAHNGIFARGTFIVSNHADELTVWTPLLAALSCPEAPLPFLGIPCCSHALSGEKWRYTLKDAAVWKPLSLDDSATSSAAGAVDLDKDGRTCNDENGASGEAAPDDMVVGKKQEATETGDLRALRALKQKERKREPTEVNGNGCSVDKSMYGCLTRKTVQVARQLDIETTCTLMRIPSTRNVGVVSFKGASELRRGDGMSGHGGSDNERDQESDVTTSQGDSRRVKATRQIIERECARSGGVRKSAEIWVERARKLHLGQGRGKVNWGCKREQQGQEKESGKPGRQGSLDQQSLND
jgi:tRNASer (uridine44-2'-O)-methyltransferase